MLVRLSHIGIIVNDIEEAKKLWAETYGLKVAFERVVESEGVKIVALSIGDSFVELAEPIDHGDMSNALAKRLATKGEGIHQVAFAVDDVAQEGERLTEKGISLIKRPPAWEGAGERLVVHPKSANGVLLELYSQSDVNENMA